MEMKGGEREGRHRDGDAEDNGRLCPRFHYRLVFNLKPGANHVRDSVSPPLSPGTSRHSEADVGVLVSASKRPGGGSTGKLKLQLSFGLFFPSRKHLQRLCFPFFF